MKTIPLNKGFETIVDDDVYEWAAQYKWTVLRSKKTHFYAQRNTDRQGLNKTFLLHREILGLTQRSERCDHINGNGLDNRRENLRSCSQRENMWNSKMKVTNTSGFKGVTVVKRKRKNGTIWIRFVAKIGVKGKYINLGYFKTIELAHAAYMHAAKIHYKEFANSGSYVA